MGVVNVTPDSFSDGGLLGRPGVRDRARAASSSRTAPTSSTSAASPRARAPPGRWSTEELDRVLPVIEALAADGVTVSVDTMRAEVAERALAAGARIVNDVSGGLADDRMLEVVAARERDVRRHALARAQRRTCGTSRLRPRGRRRGQHRARRARGAGRGDRGGRRRPGPDRARPGPGLREDARARLGAAPRARRPRTASACRCWWGPAASRSSAGCWAQPAALRPAGERDAATTALTTWLALRRPPVWGVRVHDVRATRDALAVVDRLTRPPEARGEP